MAKEQNRPGPGERYTVTDVAVALKKRYSKARDLMLTGKLGEVQKEGRTITVSAEAVEAYKREQSGRED